MAGCVSPYSTDNQQVRSIRLLSYALGCFLSCAPSEVFWRCRLVLFTGCSHDLKLAVDRAAIHAERCCAKQGSGHKPALRFSTNQQAFLHLWHRPSHVAVVQPAASPSPLAAWLHRDEERSRPARRLREFAVLSWVRLSNSCEMRRIRSRAELRKDRRRWRLWRGVVW